MLGILHNHANGIALALIIARLTATYASGLSGKKKRRRQAAVSPDRRKPDRRHAQLSSSFSSVAAIGYTDWIVVPKYYAGLSLRTANCPQRIGQPAAACHAWHRRSLLLSSRTSSPEQTETLQVRIDPRRNHSGRVSGRGVSGDADRQAAQPAGGRSTATA